MSGREPVWVVASCGHERQVRITNTTNAKELREARMRVCSDCRYARFEIAKAAAASAVATATRPQDPVTGSEIKEKL
jgi:hypothetical protein